MVATKDVPEIVLLVIVPDVMHGLPVKVAVPVTWNKPSASGPVCVVMMVAVNGDPGSKSGPKEPLYVLLYGRTVEPLAVPPYPFAQPPVILYLPSTMPLVAIVPLTTVPLKDNTWPATVELVTESTPDKLIVPVTGIGIQCRSAVR
jgi:hypothetical protein